MPPLASANVNMVNMVSPGGSTDDMALITVSVRTGGSCAAGVANHEPGMTSQHPATVAVAIGAICTVPGVVL